MQKEGTIPKADLSGNNGGRRGGTSESAPMERWSFGMGTGRADPIYGFSVLGMGGCVEDRLNGSLRQMRRAFS